MIKGAFMSSFPQTLLRLVALASLLLVCACVSGKKEFTVAMQLHQAGKHKEAIAYLEQAVAKEPTNQEFQKKLTEVKGKLLNQYLTEASQALAETDPPTMESLAKAQKALLSAQELSKDHPSVVDLANQLQTLEKSKNSQIKSLYDQAQQAMTAQDWIKAHGLLQRIQLTLPNYENTSILLAQVVDKGAQAFLDQGKQALNSLDYQAARVVLQKALSLKPELVEAKALLAQIGEKDTKEFALQQGQEAIRAEKWDLAIRYFERALQYDPNDAQLIQSINLIKTKAGGYSLQAAESALKAGQVMVAMEHYGVAQKYLGQEGAAALNTLRQRLATGAKLTADHFKTKQQLGAAWYWYEKTRDLNPEYPEIFFLIQEVEDAIKLRVLKSIAVFDFSSPSDMADAGSIVANKLITFLFSNASGDIKILERENLKSIIEEMKLGQMGVVSAQTAKEMGRIYGIDVAIMGSVLVYKVESTKSEGRKTARVPAGSRIEDNIEFLNWKAKNPYPTQSQLAAAPPAKIEVLSFIDKEYSVIRHKKVGFAQLSFRIVDVKTGENIQVKTIERKEIAEDDTSTGLPEAKIEFDPLEILTDTELLQKITSEVVAEMGQEVLRPLRDLEQSYYQEGEKLARRRESFEAVEQYVNAIFDERLKRIQHSPLSKQCFVQIESIMKNTKIASDE